MVTPIYIPFPVFLVLGQSLFASMRVNDLGFGQKATCGESPLYPRENYKSVMRELFRGLIIQVRPKPSLNLCHAHPLARVIVGDLIAINFAQAEIARFGMREINTTHARTGPHRKRFGNLHPGVRLYVEQAPDRALFCMVRARGVTWSRPYSAILLLNQFRRAQ